MMTEPRIGEKVSIPSPQTVGRYVGWDRVVYIGVVENELLLAPYDPECDRPILDLPQAIDSEVYAIYHCRGKIPDDVKERRRKDLDKFYRELDKKRNGRA
jgi:hypothetical protein